MNWETVFDKTLDLVNTGLTAWALYLAHKQFNRRE